MATCCLPIFECENPEGLWKGGKVQQYFHTYCSHFSVGGQGGTCKYAISFVDASVGIVDPLMYFCRNKKAHAEFRNNYEDYLDRCYAKSED